MQQKIAYYCFDCDIAKLENVQTDAIRLITGATLRSSICKLYREVTLPTIQTCIDNASVNMMSKILNNQAPPYLCDLVVKEDLDRPYNFRHFKQAWGQVPITMAFWLQHYLKSGSLA